MPIIESIRNYLANCPLMQEYEQLNVEFLSDQAGAFSIEEVPTQTIVNSYINGDEERQFVFVLASRFYYSDEAINNIENSNFYERFADWIRSQSESGVLPILGENKTANNMEVMTSGYLFNVNDGMRDARYQIQLRLTYDYEREL